MNRSLLSLAAALLLTFGCHTCLAGAVPAGPTADPMEQAFAGRQGAAAGNPMEAAFSGSGHGPGKADPSLVETYNRLPEPTETAKPQNRPQGQSGSASAPKATATGKAPWQSTIAAAAALLSGLALATLWRWRLRVSAGRWYVAWATMSHPQKVIAVGFLAFVLMGAFPPWEHRTDRYWWGDDESSRHLATVYTHTDYRFIAWGPQTGGSRARRETGVWIRDVSARIDVTRLAVQWVTVTVLVAGVVYQLRSSQKLRPDAGKRSA